MISSTDIAAALSVLVSLACIGYLALRWTRILLMPGETDKVISTSVVERAFMICGVLLCLLLGLFPQISYPWVVEAVAGMTQLFP